MLDMHDGLGSQLLASLARVERGAMGRRDIADTLRDCIAEMRLALDALAPSDDDFRGAFGNFRYRWDAQLADAGVQATWSIDVPDSVGLQVPAHQRLDLLRVLQEALTNVLKHAKASTVHVRVDRPLGGLRIEVRDDGKGFEMICCSAGHGLRSMRKRAQRLGADLSITANSPGTCVVLQFVSPPDRSSWLLPTANPAAAAAGLGSEAGGCAERPLRQEALKVRTGRKFRWVLTNCARSATMTIKKWRDRAAVGLWRLYSQTCRRRGDL